MHLSDDFPEQHQVQCLPKETSAKPSGSSLWPKTQRKKSECALKAKRQSTERIKGILSDQDTRTCEAFE